MKCPNCRSEYGDSGAYPIPCPSCEVLITSPSTYEASDNDFSDE